MIRIRTLVAASIAVLMFASAAFATIAWQKEFDKLYKPGADSELKKAKCAACHVQKNGKGGLNPYGKMLDKKKVEAASMKAIESQDADKDGFTNIEEIKAGTLPGDPKSKPEKK